MTCGNLVKVCQKKNTWLHRDRTPDFHELVLRQGHEGRAAAPDCDGDPVGGGHAGVVADGGEVLLLASEGVQDYIWVGESLGTQSL